MVLPSAALAEAVAQEWRGQAETINLHTLPLTRIAATAIDRVAARKSEVVTELAAFAETDLLCHRATEPADLVARQAAIWQPLLDWASLRYAASLTVINGISGPPQPTESLAALRQALAGLDSFKLAALGLAVPVAGSLVIGLALAEGRVSADEAFAAAELDATYQIEFWGEDAEATRHRAEVRADLAIAARFIGLLGENP